MVDGRIRAGLSVSRQQGWLYFEVAGEEREQAKDLVLGMGDIFNAFLDSCHCRSTEAPLISAARGELAQLLWGSTWGKNAGALGGGTALTK